MSDTQKSTSPFHYSFNRKSDQALITQRLVGSEAILGTTTIHWAIYWKPIALFIIGLLFGLFFAIEVALVICVFALFFLVNAFLKAQILLAVVTNKRMMARYGLLMVDVVDIHFDKIESIELERMLPGYIFGYSNLVIMGTGNRLVVIPYVSNGHDIRNAYNNITLADKA